MQVPLREYVAGGALVTDLVETAAGVRLGDQMTEIGQLRTFLDDHDVAHGRLTRRDLAGVRQLRAELLRLFDLDEHQLVEAVGDVLARSPHRLAAGPDHAHARHGDWVLVAAPSSSPADRLRLTTGAALLALVHALGPDRLRVCQAPDCVGRYVDTSGTGRRRFCRPERCGNRVNVARYRARSAR